MQSVSWVKYSLASLVFSVLMSLITLLHHLHAALLLDQNAAALHVVAIEVVMIPATIISMFLFLRNSSRTAFWIYVVIALLGFLVLGLFEGGWNHTAKLIAYLRIDSPATRIDEILPLNDPHLWFYEITGVATFIISMIASWFSFRFFLLVSKSSVEQESASYHGSARHTGSQ